MEFTFSFYDLKICYHGSDDELKKITRNDLYLKIITIDITKLVQISSYDFQTITKTFKTISLWHLYFNAYVRNKY